MIARLKAAFQILIRGIPKPQAPISCPTGLIIIGACRGMALCELPSLRKPPRKFVPRKRTT